MLLTKSMPAEARCHLRPYLASDVFQVQGLNIPGQTYANDYVLQMDYSTVVDPDSVVGSEIANGSMYSGYRQNAGQFKRDQLE